MYCWEKFRKIYIISYCHQDHAWTNTRAWHECRYLAFYDELCRLSSENSGMPMTLDNTFHGLEPCLKRRGVDSLRKVYRNGGCSFVMGGLALVRPVNSGDDIYIHSMTGYRRELRELLGEAPVMNCCLNADTAFGHAQLPQLLKLCGCDFYRVSRPQASFNLKNLPTEFVFKGIDGTELLCSRGPYISNYDTTWSGVEERHAQLDRFLREEVGEDELRLHTADTIAVFCGGDDSTPLHDMRDNYIGIRELAEKCNSDPDMPEIIFGTLEDYREELRNAPLDTLAGQLDTADVSYDMPLRGERSLRLLRFEGERRLKALETLAAMAGVELPMLNELWDGLAAFSGHAMESLFDADFEAVFNRGRAVVTRIASLTEEVLEVLAKRHSTGIPNEYVLCNPYCRENDSPVPVHVTMAENINGFRVLDAAGNSVPFEVVGWNYGDKYFPHAEFSEVDILCDIRLRPYEIRNIHLVPCAASVHEAVRSAVPYFTGRDTELEAAAQDLVVLDNGIIKAEVGKSGITSVVCCGRTVYNGGELPYGGVRFYHREPAEDWLGSLEFTGFEEPVFEKLFLKENSSLRQVCLLEGRLCGQPFREYITLNKGSQRIELSAEFDVAERLEGVLKAVFPATASTEAVCGIPYGEVRIDTASLPYIPVEHERSGIFAAKHFVRFGIGSESESLLLTGDNSVYCEQDTAEGSMGIYLMTCLCNRGTTQRWILLQNNDIGGMGHNVFNWAIIPCADTLNESNVALWQRYCVRTFSRSVMYGKVAGDGLPGSFTELDSSVLAVSRLWYEAGRMHVRLFNPTGVEQVTHITCYGRKVFEERDFNGNILQPASDEFRFGPFEIKELTADVLLSNKLIFAGL